MTEYLDYYDDSFTHLGVKDRPSVHRDGDWHRVFHCWITYRDADGVDWLVAQKRSAQKATFPNRIDVTAAGHYLAGESIPDGLREVREELGIVVPFESLIPLGVHIDMARYGDQIDRELSDVFLLIHAQSLHEYQVQVEEVAGLVAFRVEDGIAFFEGQQQVLQASAAGWDEEIFMLHLEDFVPRIDAYWLKVCLLARRALNGERKLYI
jgi:isopentenyldiphosphate isomerase